MTRLEPERFRFTSADGLSIACMKWSGHHVHGLGEHMGRYAELAETLVHGECSRSHPKLESTLQLR